ncbi:glycoside hydrolase family 13 protein [Glycomyces sp. TRM65418]|uniref:glycoside hydrolase family 13 protein n=1 Tax=Glycomyces sp. TRM65418 TaxID=2867006 RepID=UPI001CE4C44D|nr:glycoside hydrolase family 13 protein [Glycomyces sp. TRM65418]MCC3764710.1 glycoside hydrolase family 13 protein [Glycomyces sp. TRM65418]QZD54369.1 glycoside hydrolase family 13 protein [Glycomyces sp. TRM65418]
MSWWRDAAIYQVYLRSFTDGDGDGLGDLRGLESRLPYLRDLGVDALWLSPWYRSPMADGGYDVTDYRAIDPAFGTLQDAERLIGAAHQHGLKVIVDIVPNHTSDQHVWFQEALRAGPGSPERERYHFRDEPNNWLSRFGGPAWSQVADGQWYLHLFDASQPDLNWEHPEVRAEFVSILRFWLDRGVDGFRIDVAARLVKEAGLPDKPGQVGPVTSFEDTGPGPDKDRPEVHDIYRDWRRMLDGYGGDRVFIGEIWLDDPERFARYLRPDELHTAFNFAFLKCPWEAGELRAVIDRTLATHARVGAPPSWVLSNHDVTRHVTRYGREDTRFVKRIRDVEAPTDLDLGRRRARAAVLLDMALPGGVYVYQGEELGLPEVFDLPDEARQDPVFARTGGADPGRDGCRVPLPWSGDAPPFGFGANGSWLPQPPEWHELTADRQAVDPASMLSLYRMALRIRREEPALGDGGMRWLESEAGVLAFEREPGFACVVNLSDHPVALPAGAPMLASAALVETAAGEGKLPPDAAVWLRTSG